MGSGFDELASRLSRVEQSVIVLEGYGGVLWDNFRTSLLNSLANLPQNKKYNWINIQSALKSESLIDEMISAYLGGDDPIFGTRFKCNASQPISVFFDDEKLASLRDSLSEATKQNEITTIVYGCGAALAAPQVGAYLVYLDVPKNEIQYRSRAGSITNLGATKAVDPKKMYKRFYFVDWVVLNAFKKDLLPRIDLIVDEQNCDLPVFLLGDAFRCALQEMSQTFFRARPWFEPGVWGGQWMKALMPQLASAAPNYAWSFELIVPENGIALTHNGLVLEVSFDCLMYLHAETILGKKGFEEFGVDFPIRFDFLDTFDGGNLSLQCHPRQDYMMRHFGEPFTQDETYYILDAKPGSLVYLGFKNDINPSEFKTALETSFKEAKELDVPKFINAEPAKKHDLFLIPHGTVHCSGKDVLVLEVSATPYIFTFKMYDWQRLDMDGKPRPINIDRAFKNIYFDRRGDRVKNEFVSHQTVISSGPDFQIVHVPTHPDHFFDCHRYEFDSEITFETHDSVQVMSVVEGTAVELTVGNKTGTFNYAESFVVPAGAKNVKMKNLGAERVKVLVVFLKPDWTMERLLQKKPGTQMRSGGVVTLRQTSEALEAALVTNDFEFIIPPTQITPESRASFENDVVAKLKSTEPFSRDLLGAVFIGSSVESNSLAQDLVSALGITPKNISDAEAIALAEARIGSGRPFRKVAVAHQHENGAVDCVLLDRFGIVSTFSFSTLVAPFDAAVTEHLPDVEGIVASSASANLLTIKTEFPVVNASLGSNGAHLGAAEVLLSCSIQCPK